MSSTFFNFRNDASYHFFMWLTESGKVDTDKLIRESYGIAEDDKWIEMGADVCYGVRDKLAESLDSILVTLLGDFGVGECDEIGVFDFPETPMLNAILYQAAQSIDTRTVAVAILMRAGRWTPSKELPEIIGGDETEPKSD